MKSSSPSRPCRNHPADFLALPSLKDIAIHVAPKHRYCSAKFFSRWRTIAMTFPQLWSSLSFRIGLRPDQQVSVISDHANPRKQIQQWLTRARDSALSLQLTVSSFAHPPLEFDREMAEMVVPRLTSCRTLRLTFVHSNVARSFRVFQICPTRASTWLQL